MTGFIRRVVTGHDKNGKAVVISDGLAPAVKTNPLRPGHRSTDIWKTNAAPAPITADEPDPTLGPRTLHPAPRGTVIRIAEIAPESDELRNLTPDGARPVDAPIARDAPAAYFATLPVRAIHEALTTAGLPAVISNSAGTFVCNRVFYTLMHFAATGDSKMRGGFLHVPCWRSGPAAERAASAAAISLADIVRGIVIALEASSAAALSAPRRS